MQIKMFQPFLNPNNMKNKILITALIIISLIIAGYICLLSDFNPMFRNDEFINLKKALDNSNDDELSSFVDLYNRINKSNENKYCPCDVITRNVDPFRHVISPRNKIYSLKIKKDFGHDNCLKYELLNSCY